MSSEQARAEAERVLEWFRDDPDVAVPDDVSVEDAAEHVDPEKPHSVNMNRVGKALFESE